MEYGVQKYSDDDFFMKIENLLNRAPEFIDEKQCESYYNVRSELFKENLLKRFDLIIGQATYFMVEENYTEHAWKELHALHYTNTNYSYGNKVVRVHFWNHNLFDGDAVTEINQKNVGNGYLGYVTLRPVPDYNLMLSFIMPNWGTLKYEMNAWIMTYERIVHICGLQVLIKTIPFYFQDTVFIRCAHADMLMFSLFLHHAYNFPRLSIADMIGNNRYYPIPNGGLEYSDMLDIFYRNKIPVNFYYKPKRSQENDVRTKCVALLNSHLESKLPVIVYNNQHVVLVIGHTEEESEKRFLVYDDSGYFLSQKAKSKNFIGTVKAMDLFPDNGETYMIAATYERIYLNPQEYFYFLDDYLTDYESDGKDNFPNNFTQCRNIMVDNVILKGFLSENCMELDNFDVAKQLELFLKTDQPHYLWYSEYSCDDYRHILVADPTYPSATKENIFPYGGFYCKSDGNGISFLTKVTKN